MTDHVFRRAIPGPVAVGDAVRVTFGELTVAARVVVASANARSIAVEFEAILGGYVGMMPLAWVDDHYEDLVTHTPVRVARADPGAG
jgi:hypothetical protein